MSAAKDTVSLPWLTAQKAARVLAWVVVVQTAAIVGLVVWHQLNPVTIKEPVYVEFQSSGNTVARIERVPDSLARSALVVGAETRRFVVDRETVDRTTESERYPRVFAMSDAPLAKVFRETYGGPTSLFKREGFKRSVQVARDSALGEGIHQVEIVTTDTERPGAQPVVQEWIVTMTYEFRSEAKSYEQGLLNPMGFTVIEYTITRRNKS